MHFPIKYKLKPLRMYRSDSCMEGCCVLKNIVSYYPYMSMHMHD